MRVLDPEVEADPTLAAASTLRAWLLHGCPPPLRPLHETVVPGAYRVPLLPGNLEATVRAHLSWWHGVRPDTLAGASEAQAIRWLAEYITGDTA